MRDTTNVKLCALAGTVLLALSIASAMVGERAAWTGPAAVLSLLLSLGLFAGGMGLVLFNRAYPEDGVRAYTRAERRAAASWRIRNAAAYAAGCKCGAPATQVRRYGGTVGGVPFEVWSCLEHRDVFRWTRSGGVWRPSGDLDAGAGAEAWRVG